jgi:hypothetical protein
MPQQRDRFGWNGKAFAKVVHEFFQRHGEVFHFANATKQVSRIQPMWTIFVSFSLIASMVFYIMMMAK